MPSVRSLLAMGVMATLMGADPTHPPIATATHAFGMTFVAIPAGSFPMGSPGQVGTCPDCAGKGQDRRGSLCEPCLGKGRRPIPLGEARPAELPQHPVTVPGFWFQTTEVTRGQWKAVMGTEPWSRYDLFLRPGDDFPATFISHRDVEAFLARLNTLDRTHVYRLPSEAEWEYAAHAGSPAPSDLKEVAWFGANAFHGGEKYTHRVAQKSPNAWGLYDMLGNTWEWVADAWNPDHHGHQGSGPRLGGDITQRVLKGGSWRTEAACLRPAARNAMLHTEFAGDLGFRLVATPVASR